MVIRTVQLYSHMQKNYRTTIYLIAYKKISSKWVKYLNIRCKAIKLLEENIGKLLDISLGNDILDLKPKANTNK